ncbi:MAG: hypothetical protein LBL73_07070 [Synergistaceae bacterium]|jgi:hypothetical protein|nr:hypothetical protein [Synergistaceae bacterium]
MSETLRLHSPVNLGGALGYLKKGDHEIGKGAGKADPVVLKHWLIKAMLSDGKAVILSVPEIKEEKRAPKTANKKAETDASAKAKTADAKPVALTEEAAPPGE